MEDRCEHVPPRPLLLCKNIGGCPSTWSKNTSICLWGVSLPELLSRLSNYCLTRRRAQCTPTLYHNTRLQSPPPLAGLQSLTPPSGG